MTTETRNMLVVAQAPVLRRVDSRRKTGVAKAIESSSLVIILSETCLAPLRAS